MSTYGKRPRQTFISGPQTGQTGSSGSRPGPAGAAVHPDLMPVGGFTGNVYQQGRVPTSGRGAANFNRNTNNDGLMPVGGFHGNLYQQGSFSTSGRGAANFIRNTNYDAYSNPPTGRGYQTGVNQRNYPQSSSSGAHQQNLGGNTLQNRSLPSGRGRSCTQSYNPVLDTSTCNQRGPYHYGNNTSGYGYNQNTWNGGQQTYNSNRTIANNSTVSLYGQPPNPRNYQQQQTQPRNQSNSIFQGTGRGGTGQNRRGSYQTNTSANTLANQALDISDEWNNSFTESSLPGASAGAEANNITKDTVKVSKTDKTVLLEVKKSLHFLTVDIAGVKRWSKFKDSVQIMFEMFGQLDSAVSRPLKDCKEFLIRDDKKNAVTCVFYEIDRQLPKMTRGQWYRIVGSYDGRKEQFRCFSVRAVQTTEGNLAPMLTQKSTEIMCKLTRNLREP